MYRFLFLFAFTGFLANGAVQAQGEINASVRIQTPQLQRTDRRVFDQLETSLREWINNTKWTKETFEQDERIKCNFILTIDREEDNNAFSGQLAVQAIRPVFGSSYESPLISHLDKDVAFSYEQNQPLEFLVDNAENSNLTAVFAFYIYTILGLDFDSFSQFGGESYLLTANQIVTNVQNSNTNRTAGWKPGDGGKNRNRYWVIENLLNPRVRPYRIAMYNYHRNGLDLFTSEVDKGKVNILLALEEVEKVGIAYFNSMIVQMFANAKKDELVEMWKVGARQQKDRVIQIMIKIDPANTQRYREIGSLGQ